MDILLQFWNGLTTNLDLVVAVAALFLVVHLGISRASAGGEWSGKLKGLDTWTFVGVILGARAAAAIPEWNLFVSHPLDLIRFNQGLSLYGALGGGAAVLALYGWRYHRSVLSLADAFAVFFPLGIALHRLGCLAYGFCGGRPADFPLGIPLPGHVGTRYPSELVEGLLALGLFLVLIKLARRPLPGGTLTGVFLFVYPAVRAAVDLTRFPTGPWPWTDPLVSLGVAASGLTLLLILWFRQRRRASRSVSAAEAAGRHIEV